MLKLFSMCFIVPKHSELERGNFCNSCTGVRSASLTFLSCFNLELEYPHCYAPFFPFMASRNPAYLLIQIQIDTTKTILIRGRSTDGQGDMKHSLPPYAFSPLLSPQRH